MSKEELEEVEYYDEDYDEDYSEEQDEFSDSDKVKQDSNGQVKFKSVNHQKRAEANGVETDGEIATYANYALEYFGYRCALSGEKFVAFDNPVERKGKKKITTNLSAEHVLALTTGGNDIIPNIVPSVLQYNLQKNGYYILDWWTKAKDINGNSIYSPEKLLKIVNYMLKSLQIRKELGIKKNPREYRKRLLTPNEIDEFLMQEEIAEKLLSDTITATTEVEDGKKILTQIPQKEGEIPSLAKQKDKGIKITEEMFLTDALEVLGREKKIPQEIIVKLQNLYKQVEGEIPFEIEVRRSILSVLEQMGIENNKYTVAMDLLNNTEILEEARKNPENIQFIVKDYIETQLSKIRQVQILSEEQLKIVISNKPAILYDETEINKIKLWSTYRSSSFEELILRNYTVTDELIDVFLILKKHGIDLSKIKSEGNLDKLLGDNPEKEKIIQELQEINPGIEEKKGNWPIGKKLNDQKQNIDKLKEKIKAAGLDLTDEERKIILEINKGTTTQEFVQVLVILKKHGIDLSKITQNGKLDELLGDNPEKEKIIQELQEINPDIEGKKGNWPIRTRLNRQKKKIEKLQEEIKAAGLDLTDEERKRILEKRVKKKVKEAVVEQKNNGELGKNQQIETEFEQTIKQAEETLESEVPTR